MTLAFHIVRKFLRGSKKRSRRNEIAKLTETSGLPTSFVDELAFWDLELSGWGYHDDMIKHLTVPDHMSRKFPPTLRDLVKDFPRPRVLDVGSGPLSHLGFGPHSGLFDLVATDPLAEPYKQLLRENQLTPSYPILAIKGEGLLEAFGPRSFHIVWTRNAIDHSLDPSAAFRNMTEVLVPSGYLIVTLFSREGTAEGFHGLHQHDIYLDEANRAMLQSFKDGKLLAPVCLTNGLPLVLVKSSGPTPGVKELFEIVWKKS